MDGTPLDWSGCSLVEVDPRRVGGRPVIKGTRMPADDVVANYEYGVSIEEIAEQFRIAPAIVRELLSYADGLHPVARTIR
jgi:uncharacterized protein (DUF433 family)